MANTPGPPIRSDADVRSIADMPLDVETIFAFAKEVSLEVLDAAMLLRCWAWHQVPGGSLPDNDEALAAMVGLRRDVWQRVRALALAEVEKKERRKADDRRRQKAYYDRQKLAKPNGNGTPEPNEETRSTSPVEALTVVSTAPHPVAPLGTPSIPHMRTAPLCPDNPAVSHVDEVRDGKPHTSNGQTAATALTNQAKLKPAQPAIPAGIEVGTPGYQWDPDKLTDDDWDRVVARYVASGVSRMQSASLGPP